MFWLEEREIVRRKKRKEENTCLGGWRQESLGHNQPSTIAMARIRVFSCRKMATGGVLSMGPYHRHNFFASKKFSNSLFLIC